MKTPAKPALRLRFMLFLTGGAILSASPAMAQAVRPDTATPPPPETPATEIPVVTQDPDLAPPEDGVVIMSPFQVDATRERGYFADNTLAGSRMKTNIADLASSITVVTKQQMEDTASLDINDIFRYEANTEGSLTYTPVMGNQRTASGYADTIGGYSPGGGAPAFTNATANRVRGLSAPSMALNYYQALEMVPFDAYNTASVEVSRGPNSMLFGMGSPSGIVNQSTAQALINKNTAQVSFRTDDRGSVRASLNFNKSLIRDKLAIYGAFLYNDQQFERKPSYDTTRRAYGTVTYRPFRKTTLRASIEGYDNSNRRPNFASPRDFASEWLRAGKPAYDSTTGEFINGSGERIPYVTSVASPLIYNLVDYVKDKVGSADPNLNIVYNTDGTVKTFTYNGVNMAGAAAITNELSPNYIPGINFQTGRPTMLIQNGGLVGWWDPGARRIVPQWGTATDPSANATPVPLEADIWANPVWTSIYNNAQWTKSSGYSAPLGTVMTNYRYPGVSDRSIYDWTNVNINQMNFGEDRNTNYNLELEQEIIPGLLHFNAGWFRQDFDSTTNYTVAQLDATTIFVDTNLFLPDGSPNPNYGIPFVEDIDPDTFGRGVTVDNYRALIAYTPDFTKGKGWTKWLGRHQLLGLFSYMDLTDTRYRNRLVYTDAATQAGKLRYLPNPNNKADGTPSGWALMTGAWATSQENGRSLLRQYYLGAPGGPPGVVTQSSGKWPGATSFDGTTMGYDFNTNSWVPYDVSTGLITHSGNTQKNQRTLASYSAGLTSYWWEERLITTLGIRRDINKTRLTTNAATADSPAMTNQEKWINGIYQTGAVFNRWTNWNRLAGTTTTIGGVLKPFMHWENIERRAASGSLLWEFIRDFGISYNRSDNFDAPTGTMIDFFGTPLPKPEGSGEDYGVQFTLFDKKLFARINWFKATNENAAATPGQSIERLRNHVDMTSFRNWARRITLLNLDSRDPRTDPDWGTDLTAQGITDEMIEAAVETIWKQPYDYYVDLPGTVSATQSQEAKGMEVQITYNPVPNWTMKLTAAKQRLYIIMY